MRKRKGQSDADICMAISGNDDMSHAGGLSVVEDYFKREREENRRESGMRNLIKVKFGDETLSLESDPDVGRSEYEIRTWKDQLYLSELEQARTNRPEMEYPRDEFDCGISLPKSSFTETV